MAKYFPASTPSSCCWRRARSDNLGQGFAYVSLAVGSLLALFLYPHSLTGLLSSASRHAIRRNAILLPVYSLALALMALLGYMAVAAGVKGMPEYAAGFASFGNNFAMPALFLHMFPAWFAGVAFAAIAIGALVPASIMAIACGNLFTRNIYKEFIAPDCTPAHRSQRRQAVPPGAEAGGAVLCAGVADLLRHPAAASGRHLDLPDRAGGADGAVHPLLHPVGPAGGLGGGHRGRHLDGVELELQKLDLSAAHLRR